MSYCLGLLGVLRERITDFGLGQSDFPAIVDNRGDRATLSLMVSICSILWRATTLFVILPSASESLDLMLIIKDVSSAVIDKSFTDILLIVEASSVSLFPVLSVLVEGNAAVFINWEFPLSFCLSDRSGSIFFDLVNDEDSVARGCLIFPIFLITGLIIFWSQFVVTGFLLWPIRWSLYRASHVCESLLYSCSTCWRKTGMCWIDHRPDEFPWTET